MKNQPKTKVMDKIRNIADLTERLADVFNNLENGSLEYKVASELNNTAGKMINAAKVQLEYAAMMKRQPNIKFLTA